MAAATTTTRQVVRFENNGDGQWFGNDDFWLTAMLAWDDDFLYLAVEVLWRRGHDGVWQGGCCSTDQR